MFTPGHRRTAAELLRVVRPGGRIGLAAWTPEGFIGELFRLVGSYVPPPAGVASPLRWGDESYVVALFGPQAEAIRCAPPLQLPLPLPGPLDRDLPPLLRPDAQGVCRARRRRAEPAPRGPDAAARIPQRRRPGLAGGSGGIPRNGARPALRPDGGQGRAVSARRTRFRLSWAAIPAMNAGLSDPRRQSPLLPCHPSNPQSSMQTTR